MKKGISLLEIIIVAAVASILSAMALYSLSSYRDNELLRGDTERVLSLLSDARARTLASRGGSSYGVHLEDTKAVLFRGASYSAGAIDNEISLLNSGTRIYPISLEGGGSEVAFARLTGGTEHFGTITVVSRVNSSRSRIISISSGGALGAD